MKPLTIFRITLTAALLTSCATIDRPHLSSFEPIGASEFRFKARADAMVYREDTTDGEEERMRWLQQYLTDNGICPTGYDIVSRRVVIVAERLMGRINDIFYTGRCRT